VLVVVVCSACKCVFYILISRVSAYPESVIFNHSPIFSSGNRIILCIAHNTLLKETGIRQVWRIAKFNSFLHILPMICFNFASHIHLDLVFPYVHVHMCTVKMFMAKVCARDCAHFMFIYARVYTRAYAMYKRAL
jgi:hypothetical protein